MTASPDYSDYLLGWRCWGVSESSVEAPLRSTWAGAGWTPGVNVAKCLAPTRGYGVGVEYIDTHPNHGPVPWNPCGCGLYARHEHEEVLGHAQYHFQAHNYPMVLGLVQGWGRVQIHCDQWRAERARIVALYAAFWGDVADKLADLYQVPVHTDLATFLRVPADCGAFVPADQRPKQPDLSVGFQRQAAQQMLAQSSYRFNLQYKSPQQQQQASANIQAYFPLGYAHPTPPPRPRWFPKTPLRKRK